MTRPGFPFSTKFRVRYSEIHIDLAPRRSKPMPDNVRARLAALSG